MSEVTSEGVSSGGGEPRYFSSSRKQEFCIVRFARDVSISLGNMRSLSSCGELVKQKRARMKH